MNMIALKVITILFVVAGIISLIFALKSSKRISEDRFQHKNIWKFLQSLVMLFIIAYVVYAINVFNQTASSANILLSILLFVISIFIFLVCRVHLQNVLQMHYIANLQRYHALHDELTGLENRVLFYQRITQAITGLNPKQKQVSVCLIDLDRFKEINDTLGHVAGDRLIKKIAPRLKSVLRENDTLARIGGDEFAIVLPDTGAGIAQAIALKLLNTLSTAFEIDGHNINIAMSIGISVYPQDGFDSETLIQKADIAMYIAKADQSGCALYDEKRDQYSLNRLKLTGELHKAINNRELEVHYQPIIDIHKSQICSVEALLRWKHPEAGLINPENFIPLAEKAGIMNIITEWVLQQSLNQLQKWKQQGIHIDLHVNLSMSDIQDADFPKTLFNIIKSTQSSASNLTLEITESSMMTDLKQAKDVLTQLHEIGVKLAIDDFGTGFSSLSYLKQLPTQELKIDKSFVSDMLEDDDDAIIVRSTVDLAHNMGRTVTAEGVSDKETYDLLEILGCNRAQGYFICKPLSAEDISTWFVNTNWIKGNVYSFVR